MDNSYVGRRRPRDFESYNDRPMNVRLLNPISVPLLQNGPVSDGPVRPLRDSDFDFL